jgi:steroid delta-isomerase-like uncharacterized protein
MTEPSRRLEEMAEAGEQGLRERREAIVAEHIAAENRRDIEATVATFHRPRYEVNGEVTDGEAAVRELLQEFLAGSSDGQGEIQKLHHADDAVICEVRVTGTHDGAWAGIPATGRRIDYPLACIFDFEEDRLLCEKVYFDGATILTQIGVLPDPATA